MAENGIKNETEIENDQMPEGEMPDLAAQAEELIARLQKTEELERELTEWKNKYARLFADFENYRRRTSEDVLEAKTKGEANAIETVLPIYDDLSRAIEVGTNDPSSLLPGLKSVHENFLKSFANLGLELVPGVGTTFDPFIHEALSMTEGDEEDKILEVYQTGFKLKGKLLRPARVIVSKKKTN